MTPDPATNLDQPTPASTEAPVVAGPTLVPSIDDVDVDLVAEEARVRPDIEIVPDASQDRSDLPTMDDLTNLSRQLDAIDAKLAELDNKDGNTAVA